MSHPHTIQQFRPSAVMIALADACFLAIANESYVRGVVECYQAKILRERDYCVAPENATEQGGTPEVITDVTHTFLMSKDDFCHYHQRCLEEQHKYGLTTVKPGNSALSEAAHATRVAKTALFDSMSYVTGMTAAKCIEVSLSIYEEMMELILDLFANHVSDAQDILSRVLFVASAIPATSKSTPNN